MSKKQFFIDFDLTITDSIKAFTDTYSFLFSDHPEFVPANPNKITQYNFKCVCPLINHSEDIFKNKYFFNVLDFIDNDTYDVLVKLNDKYKVIIATIGTPKNLAQKTKWLESKLPFIDDYVLIKNKGNMMNKSVINMQDSLFLDDIPENLWSSNAQRKILFGKIYPWNKDWKGEHCLNWKEVGETFL